MDCKEIREMYKLMFAEYPDIVTVKDLQIMLGISRHAAYDLLGEGEMSCIGGWETPTRSPKSMSLTMF